LDIMTNDLYLGIEIGGTKLQLGVGAGDGSPLVALERRTVDPTRGAAGILDQMSAAGAALLSRYDVRSIGVGFGGPVNAATGCVVKSHQITGWEGAPLRDWCQTTFGKPTVLGNDCDAAALAEARFGAGQGRRIVFFITVGTGVGGGLVIDGHLHGSGRPAVAEIGHLRPGLQADRPDDTVESIASGWGIAAAARARLSGEVVTPFDSLRSEPRRQNPLQRLKRIADAAEAGEEYAADLWARCEGDFDRLDSRAIAQAASDGNELAREVLAHACQALGWAIAQVVTLVAPEVIVIGGGVSLIGESLFFNPVRAAAQRYVFPPLAGSFEIVPAVLGELVVVHGALALAQLGEHLPAPT
jgi:glucokinase